MTSDILANPAAAPWKVSLDSPAGPFPEIPTQRAKQMIHRIQDTIAEVSSVTLKWTLTFSSHGKFVEEV